MRIGPRRYWTWERFEPAARTLLLDFHATHGRLPSSLELRDIAPWFVSAAYKYFGGYHAVLQRLNISGVIIRQAKKRVDGWFVWGTYAKVARPVLLELCQRLGRTPYSIDLKRARQQWLLSAAYRYHGGYLAVLDRMGIPRPARRPRPKKHPVRDWVTKQSNGFVPRFYWQVPEHQAATLREHFPDCIEAGVMPTSSAVRNVAPGLAVHWLRQSGGWPAAAKQFGLLAPIAAQAEVTQTEAVDEALTFLEQHHRWPTRGEMTNKLRYMRWGRKRLSWDDLFRTEGFHRGQLTKLADRWKRHVDWATTRGNSVAIRAKERLTAHLIALQIAPLQRSSA